MGVFSREQSTTVEWMAKASLRKDLSKARGWATQIRRVERSGQRATCAKALRWAMPGGGEK